jgi:tetratricopeptide (TPR) repeat protein
LFFLLFPFARGRLLARDPREIGPTELLQAKFGVVGYIDATGIRAQRIDWCAGNARPTAGRLIHGPGGLGKTRLMIKVAATLRQQGWTAGFLDRPHEQLDATLKQRWQALDQLIAHGEDEGLIIVLDYAEGRQDEVRQIAERLSARPESDTRPIRLVLLARSAGEWWTTLHDDTPEVQRVFRSTGSSPDVAALPAISRGQQRLDLFDASLKAFAPLLSAQGHVLPADEPSQERRRRIESGIGYSRPLAIQMEALLWLASAAPDAGVTLVDVLLRRVLGLERKHWKKLVGALDEERTRDMARGVAQVTAVQGVPSAVSTERLLMADDFYQGQRTARAAVDPVVRHLCRVYGKPDGGVGPLEPDLIGEHHVATVGDIELIDGCLRWIEAEPADMRGKRRRDLLTVLQRATQPEHGTEANNRALTLLDHLVSTQARTLAAEMVAVMVDTPGALADRLDQHVDMLDEKSLGAITAALPNQSLSLMNLSLRVAVRRAHLARQRLAAAEVEGADQHESRLNHLAACMGTVGLRLSNLGRREQALAASGEAVDIRRRLAQIRPDAFLPDLARSISVMSEVLATLERHAEATQAAHQALEILAPFVECYPEAYGQLARTIGADALRYSEAAEQPPNMALLERVARALGSDGSG